MQDYLVSFVLDKEAARPDARLRCRVRFGGVRFAFSVGYRVETAKWSPAAARCLANTTHGRARVPAHVINAELQRIEEAARRVAYDPAATDRRAAFLAAIGRATATGVSVADDYRRYVREASVRWSDNTRVTHTASLRHLERFDPAARWASVSPEWLERYVGFLLSLGLRNASVNLYAARFRSFAAWARRHGLPAPDLAGKVRRLRVPPRRVVFLTWDELRRLADAQLPPALSDARDVFLFCAFTSLRYSDVARLRKSDIRDGCVVVTSQKTLDPLRIELNRHSRAVLGRHADLPGPLALPVPPIRKYNASLREAARRAGIDEEVTVTALRGNRRTDTVLPKWRLVTSHAARRTFISNALMMGIPPQVVMKWTGHSDYQAMKPYIDIADEAKRAAMRAFDEHP